MIRKEIRMPSNDTKSKILRFLSGEDLTAIDISEELDINESAVRRHLSDLENKNLVDHYFENIGTGRPKKFFRITEEGEKTFPRETELIMTVLIKGIIDKFGKECMQEFTDDIAFELEVLFPDIKENEKFEEKINKLVKEFDDLGFFCNYEQDNGKYLLTYKNCVFGKLSPDYAGWLCNAHKKVIEDLLGDIQFSQVKSMLKGDKVCEQIIGEKE
ncbi:MAG: helix-turn-helix transcriptional regulator [Candidatus Natronoplasma sp.]